MKKMLALVADLVAGIALAALVCLAGCALLFQLVVVGCVPGTCAPSRSFRVQDTAMPASLFPPGAIVNGMFLGHDFWPAAGEWSQSVYWRRGDGRAIYIVTSFSSTGRAAEHRTGEGDIY
jgi:hypothetical protein